MVTLTHNKTANIATKEINSLHYSVRQDSGLISVQDLIEPDIQRFENMMAEGYQQMAEEHLKFANDCIYLVDETLAGSE